MAILKCMKMAIGTIACQVYSLNRKIIYAAWAIIPLRVTLEIIKVLFP